MIRPLPSTAFDDPSALLKHELAYCLGQMKMISALPVLESVLRRQDEDPMVRHEVGHPVFVELLFYNRFGRQRKQWVRFPPRSQSRSCANIFLIRIGAYAKLARSHSRRSTGITRKKGKNILQLQSLRILYRESVPFDLSFPDMLVPL